MNDSIPSRAADRVEFLCPLCDGASHRVFAVAGFWIRQCRSCTHRFAELLDAEDHIQQTYSDDYFFAGGAGYSDYLAEERLLVQRGQSYARLVSRYCRPGTVLDVGAAAGFTLQGFRNAGWNCYGVEPNPTMASHARNKSGLQVETASFESWNAVRSFDLILILQVLPHFIDPRLAFRKAAQLLPSGGHLLIETPNRGSWAARLFGKHWHEYSPPSVLHWFSLKGLAHLADHCGFELESHGRPSKSELIHRLWR